MANEGDGLKRQYFEMLMESQFWPHEQMVAHQRTQLGHLLRHARAQSPFYEHRLDPVFRPNGDIDWDRWGEVPILKRSDLIDHYEQVMARTVPPGHGPVGEITTSGTTGVPLTVQVTKLAMLASEGARWRGDLWNHLDWSRALYIRQGEDERAIPPNGVLGGEWGPSWDERSRSGVTYRLNRQVQPVEQLKFIEKIGARYAAVGAPKLAHSLALEAMRLHINIKLDALLVHGEAVDDVDREVCQAAFGAPLIDLYSSKEGQHMARRCSVGGKWHVTSENLLLEVVDEDGIECKPGEMGRVIITPFFGTAQPLIRYEHGDMAVAGSECDCGRVLPTLDRILGRTRNLFRHPDGRTVARNMPEAYRAVLGCSTWQFAQIGPKNFEIRYVPRDWDSASNETEMAQAFRAWYFDDAQITFRRLRVIPPAASGKFMEYVYEL